MRVVIAEDLALLRDGLTRLLESNDCTVVAAVADGHALVSAIEEHRPDVAIVDVRREQGRLEVAVSDDGAGGADATGGGLTGLRRRVEALDGTLEVSSPEGGPTMVRAELPCAS